MKLPNVIIVLLTRVKMLKLCVNIVMRCNKKRFNAKKCTRRFEMSCEFNKNLLEETLTLRKNTV